MVSKSKLGVIEPDKQSGNPFFWPLQKTTQKERRKLIFNILCFMIGFELIAIIALIGLEYRDWRYRPQILISDGPREALVALDQPVGSDEDVMSWSQAAVLVAYSVNPYNDPSYSRPRQSHFTQNGWHSYLTMYMLNNGPSGVTAGRWHCLARSSSSPLLSRKEAVGGVMTYWLSISLVETCESPTRVDLSRNVDLKVTVVRTNAVRGETVAIDQFQADKR
jgi:hypothetical protein